MKKIKDFSKVIGIICRGGAYYPSNDTSQTKWDKVFKNIGIKTQNVLNVDGMRFFRDLAKEQGFKIIVIERGLNR